MLRTYKICNSTVRFSKYEFYNKLLGSVTLFKVISDVNWTQLIYIYIYIWNLLTYVLRAYISNLF